jgi:hypothetical protein
MANNFSSIEVRLIRSLISCRSDEDIAMILEKPVQDVAAKIHELTGGVGPYQAKLNKKKNKVEKKKREHKKEVVVRQQKRSEGKAKKEFESNKSKEIRKLIARQNAERQARNRERDKPLFKMNKVDYTKLIAVRIDYKTVIYAKPGEDIAEVKKRYNDRLNEAKAKVAPKEKAYKEVKKFKPL